MGKIVDRAVEAAAAVDQIVAAHAFEVFRRPRRVVAAMEHVVEIRATDAVDAGEMIGAGRGIAGRDARRAAGGARPAVGRVGVVEGDGDAGRGMQIRNPGRAIAGDDVVAAAAFKLVEGAGYIGGHGAAGILARRIKAGRVEGVGVVAAGHQFDRLQRIGADAAGVGSGAGDGARGELDADRSGRGAVIGAVIAELAIEGVVAGAACEDVVEVASTESIRACIAYEIERPRVRECLDLALVAAAGGNSRIIPADGRHVEVEAR